MDFFLLLQNVLVYESLSVYVWLRVSECRVTVILLVSAFHSVQKGVIYICRQELFLVIVLTESVEAWIFCLGDLILSVIFIV